MSYNNRIENNNTDLCAILTAINELPEASEGMVLPELANEGTSADLLAGKELIDDEGNVITGTMLNNGAIIQTMDGIETKSITIPFGYTSGGSVSLDGTIDNEVSTQINLLSQIQDVVNSLPEAGSGTSEIKLQSKTATPTTSSQNVTADSGYDGLEKVTVNAIPSTYIQPSGTKTITANGTHDVKSYESVSVNVASSGEEVTGICPSLTITGSSGIQIFNVDIPRNGQYIKHSLFGQSLPFTVENIDINQAFYVSMVSKWGIIIDSTENVNILVDKTSDDYILAKCTSTSPAVITCSEDD